MTATMDDLRNALAAQSWSEALDSARRLVPAEGREAAEHADLTAEALWWLGRLEECIEVRERAYQIFDGLGLDEDAGRCAVALWEHHGMRLRPAMAGAWLRRARRSLENQPRSVAHGALLLREAEVAHGAGDLELAVALAREVIDLGRSLRSFDLEAEALQTLGRVLIDDGQIEAGMAHLDDAMLFAVEGRLGPYATGKVYCSLISACEEVGDLDRASEWTESTLTWSERHPFAIFPGICRVHRAVVLKRRGSLAEAEAEAERACDELQGSHVANAAAAFAEVGDIRRRLGDLERAEIAFERSRELSGRPCAAMALLRLSQGQVAAASELVQQCLQGSVQGMGRAALVPVVVHVAIAASDLDAADAAASELDELVERFRTPMLEAVSASVRGRLALAHGDPSSATVLLRDAVGRWQALEVPYEVATALTLLGESQRQQDDESGALESFRHASRLFDEIGARLDSSLVDGSVTPPAAPAGLSNREVEVLRLVASGMTNAEIAEALHLSIKTVSRHLSNIFTKIDVGTRAAATAFAFETGLVQATR